MCLCFPAVCVLQWGTGTWAGGGCSWNTTRPCVVPVAHFWPITRINVKGMCIHLFSHCTFYTNCLHWIHQSTCSCFISEKSICSLLPHIHEQRLEWCQIEWPTFFSRQIPLHPFNCKSCCGILFLFKKEKEKREVGHVLSGHVLSRHVLWAL